MNNDTLTREHAEAEVCKLAASVVEEPRQGGATRLLEKVARRTCAVADGYRWRTVLPSRPGAARP